MSDMRKRVYDLLSESVNNEKDNTFYLTSERYKSLLNEKKLKVLKENKQLTIGG
jgi:hypothetical protein